MSEIKHEFFKVDAGNSSGEYKTGDYLTAINELTIFFEGNFGCTRSAMAQALRMYIGEIEAGI